MKTECNTILQLELHKRTYPELVPQEDAGRKTETNRERKNCRKESHVYSGLQQKNGEQIMDQSNRLEAKISKEKIRTTIAMDLGEILPLPTRVSLQDQTLHMGTTVRTTEDDMFNAQISQSIETMEIDLEMDLSTTRMLTGETMETFVVLHRLKDRHLTK